MKQFSLVIALMVSFSITGFAQKFGHSEYAGGLTEYARADPGPVDD